VKAEQISTLDVICGGQVVLGAALGWRDFQFRALRYRGAAAVAIPRGPGDAQRTLDAGAGHACGTTLPDSRCPRCRSTQQRPYPKILIAANLDPGVVRAATIADGWLISSRDADDNRPADGALS
jgi:alkanesulfonate monooxygenase SsuD/methylene tetrahydromethanopterin reductase-like flavin-dependent oxidoreductase (luciferase family)